MTLYQYSGSGSLNESSEVNKNRSFSYNRSSVYLYVTEDFGGIGILPQPNGFSNNSIDFSQTTHTFDEIVVYEEVDVDDYGNLTTSANETDDYGPIAGFGSTETLYPFGGLTLSGSAITQSNYRLYISGSAIVNFRSNYQTSGTLFEFGQKLENRSYAYNLSSTFDSADDYGSVTGISGLIDDYGSISESGALFEYGLIKEPIPVGILSPFGKLTLSGSAITQSNYRLYFSGSAIEKFVHYPNNLTGTLFGFGQKLESITFDYNESSISTNILDYGLLTNFVNELGDYGNILESSGSSAADSYGLITEPNPTEPITYPFGSLSISGSASKQLRTSEVGRGTIRVRGEVVVKPTQRQVGSGFIAVSGTSRSIVGLNYPTSGSLFSFGEKLESVTYDYNQDSIVSNPLVDFGSVSGVSTESYDYGLITSDIDGGIDNYGIISNPFDSTPFGTITLSGSSLESFNESPYTTSGSIFVFSGSAYAESFTANPSENAQLFNIFGSSEGKLIYNYAGFELISISGTALEKDVDSYVGVGTAFISGTALESYSPNPPENTTLFRIDISSRNYSPIYPGNVNIPGSGIGTIRINDDRRLTVTRAVLPIFGKGTIFISSSGNESFSITNYNGKGLLRISGIASTREIATYESVGFGTIILSQTGREKDVNSYVGLSSITISGTRDDRTTKNYSGFGNLTTLSGLSESYSAKTPNNIQLFSLSGSGQESYLAQTPETEVLYQFNGNLVESRTYGYEGSGQTTFGSAATTIFKPSVFGVGLFKFTTHLSDNLYDTCDSLDITCDYQDSALVKFVANPPETTILFNLSGSALTKEIQVYTSFGSGIVGISGSSVLKKTKSFVGIGTLNTGSLSDKKNVHSYFGSGSINIFFGSAESTTSIPPTSTELYVFSGSASTKITKLKRYSGIGTEYFSGIANTKKLSKPSYFGIGTIVLSGQLVYPNIKFIPAPKGIGSITILGSGTKKLIKNPSSSGSLFLISNGTQSFSRKPYSGIGTIYISDTSGITRNNPYQIPRVYVTII